MTRTSRKTFLPVGSSSTVRGRINKLSGRTKEEAVIKVRINETEKKENKTRTEKGKKNKGKEIKEGIPKNEDEDAKK